MRLINRLQKNPVIELTENLNENKFCVRIYLTQTEIDWTISVQNAVFDYQTVPKFPLTRGPEKEKLMALHRATMLFNIVTTTTDCEIQKHQESLRNTILDQCGWLLKAKAS